MFIWERVTGTATTFYTLSIINRTEGVFSGIKNIGPGQRRCKFYYKEEEEEDFISLYIYLSNYSYVYAIFAFMDGLENKTFLNEIQENTDTNGLIEITE